MCVCVCVCVYTRVQDLDVQHKRVALLSTETFQRNCLPYHYEAGKEVKSSKSSPHSYLPLN